MEHLREADPDAWRLDRADSRDWQQGTDWDALSLRDQPGWWNVTAQVRPPTPAAGRTPPVWALPSARRALEILDALDHPDAAGVRERLKLG